MSRITHHIPEQFLVAYAAGALAHPFSLVVAAHVSLCDECRVRLAAHDSLGGAILDGHPSAMMDPSAKDAILARLDDAMDDSQDTPHQRQGVYPGPIMDALHGKSPRWRSVGKGVRQSILSSDKTGSARLLYIPPGQSVPDHGHNGIEMTLVLQGAFSDETGCFGVGDLEVADETLDHTPVAEHGAPCICLAATDAPLKFNALVPRILQPLFRI